MTLEQYKESKKELEEQIRKLEEEWSEENRDKYSVNVGKYYKDNVRATIGVIIDYSSGKYSCREIEQDSDGIFIEVMQDWSTETMLISFTFISREEFSALVDEKIKNVSDMIEGLFY